MSRDERRWTNGTQNDWTEERVETVKRLYAEGVSGGNIAKSLGPQFTRNAVIGKVSRLGLTRTLEKKDPKVSQRTKRKAREVSRETKAPVQPRAHRQAAWRAAPYPTQPPEAGAPVAPSPEAQAIMELAPDESPHAVTLMEMGPGMCCWPLGDPRSPDFRYCGGKVAAVSYCRRHALRAFQPPQPRRS